MGIARRQIRWNGWGWAAHADAWGPNEKLWRWLAGEMGMPALLATPARALEDIALPARKLTAEQLAGFAAILGADRVALDDYERAFHARGRSYRDLILLRGGDLSAAPDAVLYPRGEDEVLAILALAAREKISVVPFGGGTNDVGGVTAGPGCVSVDLSGMDRVLEVDAAGGTAVAEAGITGPVLEKALAAKGLTLGHRPESFEFSTLGGWIAVGGAGQEAGHYGRAAGWLKSVRLVTAHGILEAGAMPASGPDLRHVVLGSEGTLGIISQARVHVRPLTIPVGRAFAFRDFAQGCAAIRAAARAGIGPVMLRLSDGEETRVARALAEWETPRGIVARLLERKWEAGACLLIATFADAAAARRFGAVAKSHGAMALGEAPLKHWARTRFAEPYRRDAMLDRGVGADRLECAVGWAALPALAAAVREALEAAMRARAPRPGAHGIVLGHVGQADADGAAVGFTFLFPRQLEQEMAQAQAIRRAGVAAMLAHGGAIGPDQGVGEDYRAEAGRDGLAGAALRGLKAALDPDGIMNPGKLI